MPREQIEVLRCDRCTHEGLAYNVSFGDDGQREFVLCDKHNGPLEKLREVEYGTWVDQPTARKRFKKTPLDEIPR